LVVGKDDNIFESKAVVLRDEMLDVVDIIDTPFQLLLSAEVINSDQ